jgi:radical SAM protein with 4Fe4S-binding SPASM domain
LIIRSDGTVAACCWDYNLMVSDGGFGNAAEAPLIELWRGERRRELHGRLHGQIDALPEKCRNCPGLSLTTGKLDPDLARIDAPATIGMGGFTYRFPPRS